MLTDLDPGALSDLAASLGANVRWVAGDIRWRAKWTISFGRALRVRRVGYPVDDNSVPHPTDHIDLVPLLADAIRELA